MMKFTEWVRRGDKEYDRQAREKEEKLKAAQELGEKHQQKLVEIKEIQKKLTGLRGQLNSVTANAEGPVDHQQMTMLEGSIKDKEKVLETLEAEKKALQEKMGEQS